MIEALREIGPEKEPWEKRRQVVLMYQAARLFVMMKNKHNTEPTDEEVGAYIQVAFKLPYVMEKLERKARKYQDREFQDELEKIAKPKDEPSLDDMRITNQVIKERYLVIDQDSSQNCAVLDPILFPDG